MPGISIPKIVGELIIIFCLVGWIAFWSNIAWQNYSLGDMAGAAISVVVFVLSALLLLIWRYRKVPARISAI